VKIAQTGNLSFELSAAVPVETNFTIICSSSTG